MLAHVDPVGVHRHGQFHVVVDEEGDAVPAAQGLEFQGLRLEGSLVQVLLPQLDHGGAPLQGLLYLPGQGFVPQPGPVGDRIQEQVLLIAPHTWPPCPA